MKSFSALTVLYMFYFCQASVAETFPELTGIGFAGTIALFPVPEERIANKLNEMNALIPDQEGTLNLPNYRILTEFLAPGEHVIAVGIGNFSSKSFKDTLPSDVADQYSLDTPLVSFFIPLLTGPDANGPAQYKVHLSSFVSTEKPFLNPNMALPVKQVDEFVITEFGASITNGCDYFSVSWEEAECCHLVDHVINADINEYLDELMFSANHELDFSACQSQDVQEVDMCKARDKLTPAMSQNRHNVCEYWSPLESFRKCTLENYALDSISEAFQEASLLSKDNKAPIVYEIQHQADFAANLKIPCIEL
ncbi:uncharacterized protein [Apostichopus japonicus]|uniref:uncharacterized protein n=1 Tax=Stichopus japonicus TaxID=307972 RepID=UPI003AB33D8F